MKKGLLIIFSFAVLLLNFACQSEVKAQSQSDTTRLSGGSLMSVNSSIEENLQVTLNQGGKNLRYIKIFDIIGKEVATIDVSGQSFPALFTVNLSNFKQNIYICNLYSDKGLVESKKLFRSKSF